MTARRHRAGGWLGHAPVPLTQTVSKQCCRYTTTDDLLPAERADAGRHREVLIINTPHEQALFQQLLGDGSRWGMRFEYAAQPSPDGLAQAYLIGREFVDGKPSCLVLGDNIFHGHGFTELLKRADARQHGASVFGYWVRDPERYGVAEFDAAGKVIGLEEKPKAPRQLCRERTVFYDAGQRARRVSAHAASSRSPTSTVLLDGDMHLERSVEDMRGWTPAPQSLLGPQDHRDGGARGPARVLPEEIAGRTAGSGRGPRALAPRCQERYGSPASWWSGAWCDEGGADRGARVRGRAAGIGTTRLLLRVVNLDKLPRTAWPKFVQGNVSSPPGACCGMH